MHNPFPQLAYADAVQRASDDTRRRTDDDLERLVAMAAGGDSSAWEALVARFGPYLLRVAGAHGLTRQQAEDAVQETWMRLLQNIERIREPQALGGWLKVTVRRESVRIHQRTRRERPTADDARDDLVASTTDEVHGRLDAADRRAAVTHALAALPARRRALMHALFADSAPSYDEIAAQLGMPVGSIGPIRGRCLAQLRLDGRLQRVAADALA
jgi:RNA polymerase sigma factor (sigma-70 family)